MMTNVNLNDYTTANDTASEDALLELKDDNFCSPDLDPHLVMEDESEPLDYKPLPDPEERDKQKEAWRQELEQIEKEMETLRQVLNSKMKRSLELKKNLGISHIGEMKEELVHGFHAISESDTFQKTSAAVKQAKDITSSSLYTAGSKMSEKLGHIRNSATFKSFEGKVGSAYSTVKDETIHSWDTVSTKFLQASSNILWQNQPKAKSNDGDTEESVNNEAK